MAQEVGKLFTGTSPAPSSSSKTTTPPAHVQRAEDLSSGTHMVDPDTAFRLLGM